MPKRKVPPIKIRILGARFVTSWRWSVTKDPEDTCGICRLAYESCCPTCKLPGEDCPPIIGQCKHAFHMREWLCPAVGVSHCPLLPSILSPLPPSASQPPGCLQTAS